MHLQLLAQSKHSINALFLSALLDLRRESHSLTLSAKVCLIHTGAQSLSEG